MIVTSRDKQSEAAVLPTCQFTALYNSAERASHPSSRASARIFRSVTRLGPGKRPPTVAAMAYARDPQLCCHGLRIVTSAVIRGCGFPNVTRGAKTETEKCCGALPIGTGAPCPISWSPLVARARFHLCICLAEQSGACHDVFGLSRPKPRADNCSVLLDPQRLRSPCGVHFRPSLLINRRRLAGGIGCLRVSPERGDRRQFQ